MGREKITQFYEDPVKQATDARALAMSHYRRTIAVGPGLAGAVHREGHFLRRSIRAWLEQAGALQPAIYAAPAGARPPSS
jgi:hypothetical protein